jgi:hypothetical protein
MHPREKVVADLVDRYRASVNPEEKDELFRSIAEWLVPLIVSTIAKYRWDVTLNESPNSLVNEVILKLPVILVKFKPENGSFYNYFMTGLLNCFRHLYGKRTRRAKYHGDWPLDELGNPVEIEDKENEKLTSYAKRLLRGKEYERLMAEIPLELARLVDNEYSGLVHYIAERYLTRADNREQLYFTELRREVTALPVAKSLSEREIDSLIRMVVGGVRARLYALHASKMEAEEASEETVKELLRAGSYRLWPLLMILSPAQTVMLLHCLGGVHDSVPSRDRWFRESRASRSVAINV